MFFGFIQHLSFCHKDTYIPLLCIAHKHFGSKVDTLFKADETSYSHFTCIKPFHGRKTVCIVVDFGFRFLCDVSLQDLDNQGFTQFPILCNREHFVVFLMFPTPFCHPSSLGFPLSLLPSICSVGVKFAKSFILQYLS